METSAAVFLPAAGSRWGNTSWAWGDLDAHWASTIIYRLYFDDKSLNLGEACTRSDGHAVRLVRDVGD